MRRFEVDGGEGEELRGAASRDIFFIERYSTDLPSRGEAKVVFIQQSDRSSRHDST